MVSVPPPCPTDEQIAANAPIRWHDGFKAREGFACWYPQMGGYVGRCVVVLEPTSGPPPDEPCFTAYVWHDGEFPFTGESGRKPVVLHHCGADQFVDFGELVASKAAERLH